MASATFERLWANALGFGDLNLDGFVDVVVATQDRINIALRRAYGFGDPRPAMCCHTAS